MLVCCLGLGCREGRVSRQKYLHENLMSALGSERELYMYIYICIYVYIYNMRIVLLRILNLPNQGRTISVDSDDFVLVYGPWSV